MSDEELEQALNGSAAAPRTTRPLRSAHGMEVAYTTAYAMRYLGETYGTAKIIAVLKGNDDGATTEAPSASSPSASSPAASTT